LNHILDGVNRDDDAAGIQIIQKPKDVEHQPDEQVFIAFARVFSGTVKRGASLYVLGPKHDPALVLEQVCICVQLISFFVCHITDITSVFLSLWL